MVRSKENTGKGFTMFRRILIVALLVAFAIPSAAVAQRPTQAQLDEFKQLVKSGAIMGAELEDFLRANRPTPTPATRAEYEVALRCDFSAAIRVGKYDGVYDWLAQSTPPEADCREGAKEQAVLFQCDGPCTSEEAIAQMDREGLRPATWPVLFALGADHPDLQLQFWIVALGSVWRGPHGYRGVLILNRYGMERNLRFYWFGRRWSPDSRFAAVRK